MKRLSIVLATTLCIVIFSTKITNAQNTCLTDTVIKNLTYDKMKFNNGNYSDSGQESSIGNIKISRLPTDEEIAPVLVSTQYIGGNGKPIYLYVVKCKSGKIAVSKGLDLGDRVSIQSVSMNGDIAKVSGVFHGPDDGQCCPTLNITFYYKEINGEIVDTRKEYHEVGGRWSRNKDVTSKNNHQSSVNAVLNKQPRQESFVTNSPRSSNNFRVGVINWTIIDQISHKLSPYYAQLPPGAAANPSSQDLKIFKYLAVTTMKAAEIYAKQNNFDIIIVQKRLTDHISHGTPLIRDELPYFNPSKVNDFLQVINGPNGIAYAKMLNPTNLDREIASTVDSMN
jgi:hypothetical protein